MRGLAWLRKNKWVHVGTTLEPICYQLRPDASVLCLLLHQVQLQKLSMEQEISLVEMTEQIIGKKQNFTRCGLGRTCAFISRLSDFFSAFVVVVFFVLCCRCVYPQGNLNRGTVIYGKAVPI